MKTQNKLVCQCQPDDGPSGYHYASCPNSKTKTQSKLMTNKQALAEAQRRFGRTGTGQIFGPNRVHQVGRILFGCLMVLGQGDTWEAAFKNYDDKCATK